MKAVVAIVAVLILADAAFAGTLIAHRASSPALVAQKATTHPCNHGFYVSQAAHAKKHGQGNRAAARSKLGKDGNCSTKATPGS